MTFRVPTFDGSDDEVRLESPDAQPVRAADQSITHRQCQRPVPHRVLHRQRQAAHDRRLDWQHLLERSERLIRRRWHSKSL